MYIAFQINWLPIVHFMKNFTFNFILVLSLLSISNSYAQQCGFDKQMEIQLQDPNFVALQREAEEKIQARFESGIQSRTVGNVLTIPVVMHVLHLGESVGTGSNISDAQIQSSIDNLNDFYRGQTAGSPVDFEIEFTLAKRDPNCNPTDGINRINASSVPNYSADGISFNGGPGAPQNTLKDLSRWPETDYFNIWIVTEIEGNNGGAGFQGYANFYTGSAYEGSVMMHTVFGYDPTNANPSWPLNFSRDNSTVVHEAGHYFHLYHTFQGDDTNNDGVSDACPADTTVGVDSDGCADTVPHQRETSTCPANNACTGNPWIDDNTINNIMSYYFCTDKLTDNQKTRARAAMEGTSLVGSNGSLDPDPTYAPPMIACYNNTAPNIDNHYAGITNVELNGKEFSSFSTLSDGGNIDDSDNCVNYFVIDATESNTLNVTMFTANIQQLGVWIDWNDDGDFDDDAEQQHFSQDLGPNALVPIVLTYPATIPYGDYVRVRLITDLDDDYGFPVISSACYTNLAYGQSEDYAIYLQPGPVTYTYNGSWSPSTPIGVSTMIDDVVVNSGTIDLISDLECNNLTVNPDGAITVNSGVTLTTNTINLNSTSQMFSSLIANGTITGTVNYNRFVSQVSPIGTNDLITAPLSGQNFGDFATANTNLAPSGSTRAFAPYNTTVGAYQNYDTGANAATIISSGTGYRVGTTDGSALTFTGTALAANVDDVAITDASAGFAWNLIGNPYPSYLDFDAFFQQNKDELHPSFQAIYGYNGNATDKWTIWNQIDIDDITITELFTPGQAFFVKSKSGGGLVDFTTAMRTIGSSDDFISSRQPLNNLALCKLNISSTTNSASTKIYFIDGTTRGLDPGYDAGNYIGSADEFSIFSNLVEDNTGVDMAIQALSYNDLDAVIVPLGVNASSTTQLTIGIDDISNIPSHINVYLEDSEENTFTLLNTSDYVFTPNTDLNGIGRFYVHFSNQTLSTDDKDINDLLIFATDNPKEIVIKGLLNVDTKAALYDIRGRLILRKPLNTKANENIIDVSGVGAGVYIIELSNQNQTMTKKLIIK